MNDFELRSKVTLLSSNSASGRSGATNAANLQMDTAQRIVKVGEGTDTSYECYELKMHRTPFAVVFSCFHRVVRCRAIHGVRL
jgi:hypothetical protein